ncbi:MAG: hypothetical protein BWX80_03585 [Candidatus Hydrogenedentes bacterium ADurb.Bin101]|nr:MAG: hypothetical protein BWX80_03585 [Candidatus Hydrogenedentes bacterium ADurb.Bin101]
MGIHRIHAESFLGGKHEQRQRQGDGHGRAGDTAQTDSPRQQGCDFTMLGGMPQHHEHGN